MANQKETEQEKKQRGPLKAWEIGLVVFGSMGAWRVGESVVGWIRKPKVAEGLAGLVGGDILGE